MLKAPVVVFVQVENGGQPALAGTGPTTVKAPVPVSIVPVASVLAMRRLRFVPFWVTLTTPGAMAGAGNGQPWATMFEISAAYVPVTLVAEHAVLVGVGDGVGVALGAGVAVGVLVAVGLDVGDAVGVTLDVGVALGVTVLVVVAPSVGVGEDVTVAVGSSGVPVAVGVAVGDAVGVLLGSGVAVAVAGSVAVTVGTGTSLMSRNTRGSQTE
jgi:hypothetical protein